MSSEPPEEPHLRSEPSPLSPASPKPIHFPTPTNIPVLEMQMDVGFNQTEAHMSDPAMHNTDVRPDVWRDPKETESIPANAAAEDHPSSHATGEEILQAAQNESVQADTISAAPGHNLTDNNIVNPLGSNQADDPPIPTTTSALPSEPAQPTQQLPTSDPSVPFAEATSASQDMNAASQNQIGTSGQVQSLTDPGDVHLNAGLPAPHDLASSTVQAVSPADAIAALTLPSTAQDATETQSNSAHLAGADDASTLPLNMTPSGLPPRPPPQDQPLINPNYVHSQHIQDYHPHANNPAYQPNVRAGGQGNVGDPNANNHVPPVHTLPNPAHGGTNTSQSDPSALPPNLAIPQNGEPVAGAGAPYPPTQGGSYTTSPQNMYGTSYPSNTSTPIESRKEKTLRGVEHARPEDRQWDAEVQQKYDRFIEEERKYVSEGRWEQFPQGSRLFVGNLSSERVTKRDIFHVFHPYGELAQISIKPAYGFVQFLRPEDCARALNMEQGTQIRDKKIHLEVSKPQKSRGQNNQRRSRSPEGRSRPASNVDRYVSGSRNNNRGSYGSYQRSPSPRNYREREDDRYRRRSRSPPGYRGGSNRYRNDSPPRASDDGLNLPYRPPHEVPNVQLIILDTTIHHDFVSWVDKAFKDAGLSTSPLRLGPHLPEDAVVRRQIVEGVLAVVKLRRSNQEMSKIGLTIFDRSQGTSNVRFEEYENLDPTVAAQLVLRAKSTRPPSANPYGSAYGAPLNNQPGYFAAPNPPLPYASQPGYPPAPYSNQYAAPPPGAGAPPNLQNLITNLEPNHLQSLLSAMSTPQGGNTVPAYAGGPPPPQNMAYMQHPQHAPPPGSAGPPASTSSNPNVMQDILARLGTGQR